MTDIQGTTGPDLVGGRISLDFVNSEGAERNSPPEWITSYEELLHWAEHAGVIGEDAVGRLRALARRAAAEADRVGRRAVRFREALYRVFVGAIDEDEDEGSGTTDEDRRVFAEGVARAHAHLRLEPTDGLWDWAFDDPGALDSILWPLALDAADLLTSEELARVKECGGTDCSWLFLDQSRNRSRRWCDMAVCGNRSKARRYYRRSTDGGS